MGKLTRFIGLLAKVVWKGWNEEQAFEWLNHCRMRFYVDAGVLFLLFLWCILR
jgi:hypothetical protein